MSLETTWQQFLSEHLPTRKTENWKYANLTVLKDIKLIERVRVDVGAVVAKHNVADALTVVFVDGELANANLPAGIQLSDANKHDIDSKLYPFAALNAHTTQQAKHFDINQSLEQPLHILHITTKSLSQVNKTISLANNTSVHIIEEFVSFSDNPALVNVVTHYHLADGAKLTREKIQRDSETATHIEATFVEQAAHSTSEFNYLALGGKLSRDDLVVKLHGQSSHCDTNGAYKLTTPNKYVDYHIDIQHVAAHTTSSMLFKGVLGEKTKAVFNGRLYVEKNAQKISAEQGNHHLLLANNAESYSKPELEIYADDVRCQHGATTGELDEDAMFYLQARGIHKDDATAMLLTGFMNEVVDNFKHNVMKQRAEESFA